MEPILLETTLVPIEPVDTFKSLIWRDRYNEYGDFEIQTPVTAHIVTQLIEDRYLTLAESDHAMIIESIGITTSSKDGNKITFKGRSLESILERRIVWTQTIFPINTNFQDAVHLLLDENAINPSDTDRDISRLVFEASTDPAITSLTMSGQYTGDILYKAISDMCKAKGVGFKITITDDGYFKFKLYAGTDRSYNQSTIPYVTFSPEFDNIFQGEYFENKAPLKTITLVAGEGEGSERYTTSTTIAGGGGTDLNRREMFTDARDLSKTYSGGTLTDDQYLAQLVQRGQEDLANNDFIQSFQGQADTTGIYKFGEDFFLGDILQTADEFGHEAPSRVNEIIFSQDGSGVKTYPSFAVV